MANKWNENQQHVIDWRDSYILVSAAAGSGKTAALVERIMRLIIDDKVSVKDIVVVTFTNAAAGEMRERLINELYKRVEAEGEKDKPDTILTERLESEISLVNAARICTIDSFCLFIIRNYFYAAEGVDPGARILDNDEAAILLGNAADELMEKCSLEEEDTAFYKCFTSLTEVFSGWKNDQGMKQLLIELYMKSISHPDPDSWLDKLLSVYDVNSGDWNEWLPKLTELVVSNVSVCKWIAEMKRNELKDIPELKVWYDILDDDAKKMSIILKKTGDEELTYEELCRNYNEYSQGEKLKKWSTKGRNMDEALKQIKKNAKDFRDIYAGSGGMIQSLYDLYIDATGTFEKSKEYKYGQAEECIKSRFKLLYPYAKCLTDLVRKLDEEYSAVKKKLNAVDFSDVEHNALKILLKKDESGKAYPSDIALELGKVYKHIMIDEYQDSNLLQETILNTIAGSNDLSMVMAGAKEKPPYMFMVGDVKQSIYGFRAARPSLFLEKYNNYTFEEKVSESEEDRKDKDIVIVLDKNYRSRESVLGFANEIFSELMTKYFGGVDYDDKASLKYGGSFDGISEEERQEKGFDESSYHTELILVEKNKHLELFDSPAGKEKKNKLFNTSLSGYELQSVAMAKRIKELVEGEKPLLIKDKDECGNEILRPARYKDIAILLRSNQSDIVRGIFEKTGIPVNAQSVTGYFDAAEVSTVLSFLMIIDNPLQDIPLASVMRSSIFGFDEEDFAKIKIEAGRKDYFFIAVKEYLKPDEERKKTADPKTLEKCVRFIETLEYLREMAKDAEVNDILKFIYYDLNYMDMVLSEEKGSKKAANLEVLLDKAKLLVERGQSTLGEFVYFINNMKNENIDEGEAGNAAAGDDAVTITTIHKSKGLEYPVVFVAFLNKRFNNADITGDALVDKDNGLGIVDFSLEKRIKTNWIFKNFIRNSICIDNCAEEMRVLYVALTRAKEKLICVTDFDFKVTDKDFKDGDILDYRINQYNTKFSEYFEKYFVNRNTGYLRVRPNGNYHSWILSVISDHKSFKRATGRYMDSVYARHCALAEGSEYIPPYSQCMGEEEGDRPDYEKLDVSVYGFEYLSDYIEEGMKQIIHEAESVPEGGDKLYEELKSYIEKDINYSYPFANAKDYPSKVSVSALKEADEVLVFSETSDAAGESGLEKGVSENYDELSVSAAETGTMYHTVMRHLPFEISAMNAKADISASEGRSDADEIRIEESICDILDKMSDKHFVDPDWRKHIDIKLIKAFYESDSYMLNRMIAAEKRHMLWREQPFMKEYLSKELIGIKNREGCIIEREDKDIQKTIVQGVIDLFFIDEDGEAVLIDYKTDGIRKERLGRNYGDILVDRYKRQFELYRESIESIIGVRVKESYIYSFALKSFIPVI